MYNLCLIIFIISATIMLNTTQSACIYSFDLKKLVVYENLYFFHHLPPGSFYILW